MTIINECPLSQWVWHSKEPLLLNGHKSREWVKICNPSPAMVTSPYEWKILQRDEKPQTNKQTNKNTTPIPMKCRLQPWMIWASVIKRRQPNAKTMLGSKWYIELYVYLNVKILIICDPHVSIPFTCSRAECIDILEWYDIWIREGNSWVSKEKNCVMVPFQ